MKKLISTVTSVFLVTALVGCTSTTAATTNNAQTSSDTKTTSGIVFQQDAALVDVEGGTIRGYIDNGIYTYKGVPYATAERYEEPHKVDAWEGIKDTQVYGDMCPQADMTAGAAENINPHNFWPEATDETKIQTLNIWTGDLDSTAKKPVMFWIHGGGFSSGAATEQLAYDGHNMADLGDVVVVSINHRLNCLGYLDLSGIGGEKYAHSGNLGQMDIVAALQWVHDNIEQFGGDPENVTLFGQSGGGRKILNLLGTPSAKGLFAKVICESCGQQSLPQEIARKVGDLTAKKLGLTAETIDQIKTMDYDTVSAAASEACTEIGAQEGRRIAWSPVVDGDFMPEDIWLKDDLGDAGKDIPMIIGSVFAETSTNAFSYAMGNPVNKSEMTEDEINAALEARYGEDTEAVVAAFQEAYPSRPIIDAAYVDLTAYRGIVKDVLALREAQGSVTYNYLWSPEYPTMGGWLPWHCSELPFVFHNLDRVVMPYGGPSESLLNLQEEIFGAWMSFAKTGDPNHGSMLKWPEYKENKSCMIFDYEDTIGEDHDAEFRELALAAIAKVAAKK